jgi:fructokinase
MQTTQAQLVALTMGANGAWLLTRHGEYFAHETARLNIIDTVGAGDSFLAGLLAALASLNTAGHSLNQVLAKLTSEQAQMALGHAIASASLCVQERGCIPPTWIQAQQWAEHHPSVQAAVTA